MHDQPEIDRPRAVLLAVQLPLVTDLAFESDLGELKRLSDTLGVEIVGRVVQKRQRLRAGTVVGLGKLQELSAWTGGEGKAQPYVPRKNKLRTRREKERAAQEAREAESAFDEAQLDDQDDDDSQTDTSNDAPFEPEPAADDDWDAGDEPALDLNAADFEPVTMVIVDHELSPTQQRNLERATGAEVLDRTQVIVEIFHRHAKSREAKLQVEIARLMYVAPRLREAGGGADRQRGGVGGKGAGESALELDRRRIRDRIAELKQELASVEHERLTRRSLRRDQRRVALIGYTNAGKSSWMRALTGSEVYVANKLFATLDTTVRALKPETEPRTLISDTVGFIKKLPHELVASFRSTLDEAAEASLLIFMVDAADPNFRSELEVTREVVGELGADVDASLLVLNKRDLLSPEQGAELLAEFPQAVLVSSRNEADLRHMRERIIAHFDGDILEDSVFVPYVRHALCAEMHERGVVVSEMHDDTGTTVGLRAPSAWIEAWRSRASL